MKINDEPDESEDAQAKILEELLRLNTIACGSADIGRACVFPGDYMFTLRTGCMMPVLQAELKNREWITLYFQPREDEDGGGEMTVRINDIMWVSFEPS